MTSSLRKLEGRHETGCLDRYLRYVSNPTLTCIRRRDWVGQSRWC